ncbi:MAG: O-antigen ligase family protein [Chloroflexota bacterium]
MVKSLAAPQTIWANSQLYKGRERIYKILWHICLLGLVGFVAKQTWDSGADPSLIAWLFYVAGIAAILFRPRYGIYLIMFFGLVGDASLIYWYPFEKNLSSIESLLYLNDSVIFSPLESYILITILSWLGRIGLRQKVEFFAGELFLPAIFFCFFLVIGLMYGLATGGSPVIALWESRPIFYLPVMLVLTSNLIQERTQIKRLIWICMVAIFIEGLIGSYWVAFILEFSLANVLGLAEHSSAIHINTFFVFTMAIWIYRNSATKRLSLLLMAPPIALTYLASQRRASFVTLAVAIVFIAIILYKENRTVFWTLAPIIGVMAVAYIGIFWNNTGALGLPAQAIKSMIAPDPNSEDAASNIYRVLENVNVNFTIHESPLFGVGFGKKFFIIVPMADISFFDWWEYIVHNSIFWYWMKTGVLGFMSMLFLICSSIMVGVRIIWRLPGGELSAVATVCTLYILMHFLYAYVDMSWDNQSMIYVGTSMGLLNCFEHIVTKPVPIARKRWAWQTEPEPEPTLLPLSY